MLSVGCTWKAVISNFFLIQVTVMPVPQTFVPDQGPKICVLCPLGHPTPNTKSEPSEKINSTQYIQVSSENGRKQVNTVK